MPPLKPTLRQKHPKEYHAWVAMRERCFNPKNLGYKYYGGRGIVVCDEWRLSFSEFFSHIGPAPSPKHSVDRYPNNDGDYEPGNVRWATVTEQATNKRPRGMFRTLTLLQVLEGKLERCRDTVEEMRERMKVIESSIMAEKARLQLLANKVSESNKRFQSSKKGNN